MSVLDLWLICPLEMHVLSLSSGGARLCIQTNIQGSCTLVISSSSGSLWGQVSLALSTAVPVGPQQFSCGHAESETTDVKEGFQSSHESQRR